MDTMTIPARSRRTGKLIVTCIVAVAALVLPACGPEVSCPEVPAKYKGALKKAMKRAQKVAQRVTDREEAKSCALSQNDEGYRMAVPHTKSRDIVVRVMARGGGRKNYYRVSIDGVGSADKKGRIVAANQPDKAHHKITDDAPDEIHDIIKKLKEKHG